MRAQATAGGCIGWRLQGEFETRGQGGLLYVVGHARLGGPVGGRARRHPVARVHPRYRVCRRHGQLRGRAQSDSPVALRQARAQRCAFCLPGDNPLRRTFGRGGGSRGVRLPRARRAQRARWPRARRGAAGRAAAGPVPDRGQHWALARRAVQCDARQPGAGVQRLRRSYGRVPLRGVLAGAAEQAGGAGARVHGAPRDQRRGPRGGRAPARARRRGLPFAGRGRVQVRGGELYRAAFDGPQERRGAPAARLALEGGAGGRLRTRAPGHFYFYFFIRLI
mmetsp:Transcript_28532/g.71830  ORF Transcript_28532/g.71830 Transcript_28532/m.71830 type:complete len:279 (-) Transcript_28532:42-878(-)